jgi:hypothetical protein
MRLSTLSPVFRDDPARKLRFKVIIYFPPHLNYKANRGDNVNPIKRFTSMDGIRNG